MRGSSTGFSLAYKFLKTGQPSYLHTFLSFPSHHSTRSSSHVTICCHYLISHFKIAIFLIFLAFCSCFVEQSAVWTTSRCSSHLHLSQYQALFFSRLESCPQYRSTNSVKAVLRLFTTSLCSLLWQLSSKLSATSRGNQHHRIMHNLKGMTICQISRTTAEGQYHNGLPLASISLSY